MTASNVSTAPVIASSASIAALASRKSTTRKHKTLGNVQFKAVDGVQGICEAYVSIYGVVDSMSEVVDYGAFAKSLARKLPKVVWSHNWEKIIGKVTEAEEVAAGDPRLPDAIKDMGGLRCVMKFNMDKQFAQDCFSDLQGGYVDEFSIGYEEVDTYMARDGRHLKELNLYEVSPVLAGANPETTVVETKSQPETVEVAEPVVAEQGESAPESPAADSAASPEPTIETETTAAPATEFSVVINGQTLTAKELGPQFAETILARVAKTKKGALPPHQVDIADVTPEWNESAELSAVGADEDGLRTMHAWVDPAGDPTDQRSYKLAHHKALGKVSLAGVKNAAERILSVPEEDRDGVKAHLDSHYAQFAEKSPWQRSRETIEGTAMIVRSRLDAVATEVKTKGLSEKGAIFDLITASLPGIIVDAFYQSACMALMGVDPNAPAQATEPVAPLTAAQVGATLLALSDEMKGMLAQCVQALTGQVYSDDDKSVAPDGTKQGRVLSDRNVQLLSDAHDLLSAMGDNAGIDLCSDDDDDEGDDGDDGDDSDADDDNGDDGVNGDKPVLPIPVKPTQPQTPTPGYYARDASATADEKSAPAEEVDEERVARAEQVITRFTKAYEAMNKALKPLGIDLEIEMGRDSQ